MNIPWVRSLYGRLGLVMLLFAIVLSFLIGSSFFVLTRIRSDVAASTRLGTERVTFELLYLASRLPGLDDPARKTAVSRLTNLMNGNEDMLAKLVTGVSDSQVRAELEESRNYWSSTVRPALETAIDEAPLTKVDIDNLERLIRSYAAQLDRQIGLIELGAATSIERSKRLQMSFSAAVVIILLLVLWMVRHIARRTRLLAHTAEQISAGDLERTAPAEGVDELALLGSSFNAMTTKLATMIERERSDKARLEELLSAISESVQHLSSSAAEILAGTSQQVESMREQSSAVAETVTSVDEVLQTAEQATNRAQAVAMSAENAVQVSSVGREAIEDTVSVMNAVSTRTEAIAANMLSLAESSQEIGEIVAVVTEIADQTNLLALNAAIEASRAGEHGHGFSVVAAEIRTLADQSKGATAKVRRILIDIQKATNTAVMGMEDGAKSVHNALETVNEAGQTIRQLEAIISDAARSAAQIAASAGQQRAGMKQIHEAMHHIEVTSTQNLAAVRQAEQAAKDLNELGMRLKNLLDGQGK